jgi:hypothetical protein
MPYVARKYQRSKWDVDPTFMSADDIQADAVGVCLRTSSNNLSFWRCDNNQEDVREVALAVACKGTSIDKMNLILFDEQEILRLGFDLHEAPQNATHVEDLTSRHLNLTHLTVATLSDFAYFMKPRVLDQIQCYMLSALEVFGLLNNAISAGRLNKTSVDPKLSEDIDKWARRQQR